jgi:Tfp pilus assembly protein PilO
MASQVLKSRRALQITLKPSKKTIIALSSLMGVVLLSGIALFVWQNGQIDDLQRQANAKAEEVHSGEQIARRLEASEAAYGDSQRKLGFLETSVTAGEYVPTLLRQMEMLAKSQNLQVGAVRPTLEPAPQPPADKEARKKFVSWPYDKIHVDMQVRGSYWNVSKLVYRLTEFPKIMAVESVQVQPGQNVTAGQSPQLTVDLKLTGFIFPNDGKATVVGTPVARAATPLENAEAVVGRLAPQPPKIFQKVGDHTEQATNSAVSADGGRR